MSSTQVPPAGPFAVSFGWLAAYVGVLGLVVGGVVYGRYAALSVYGSAAAQAEWDAWRDDARQMASAEGPVKRRVPASQQPPALVLMRDHFAVCLAGAVVLSTVLFGTFMVLARGAFSQSSPARRHDRS